jgi:hypothetical protein
MKMFSKTFQNLKTFVTSARGLSSAQFDEIFISQINKSSDIVEQLVSTNSISNPSRTKMLLDTLKHLQFSDETIALTQHLLSPSSCKEAIPANSSTMQVDENQTGTRKVLPPKVKSAKIPPKDQELVPKKQTQHGKSNRPAKKIVKFTPAKTSQTLNKVLADTLKTKLSGISNRYPHFSCNDGCEICMKVFNNTDITYCSKKHGGDPCNELGLYPHASQTYLSVAHATKKLVFMPVGFENPMKPVETTPTKVTGQQDMSKKAKQSSLSQFQYSYEETEERRQLSKRKNTMYWKMNSSSAYDTVTDALKMFKLWKRAGTKDPPSWATCFSKMLFLTLDLSTAISVAAPVERRKQIRVMKRRQSRGSKRLRLA